MTRGLRLFVWMPMFFFKQKTAYVMRISDWSSDVCSSDLVALAAYGAELVALGNGLSQRIERGHPKRTLEGELRKQAMMGHGKPPCCRDWRRQREVRGTPGHRTAKRLACRTAGEPIYGVGRAAGRERWVKYV